jgi:hypothetical protein
MTTPSVYTHEARAATAALEKGNLSTSTQGRNVFRDLFLDSLSLDEANSARFLLLLW